MIGAEFTGAPPSEATLQIIRAVLAEYDAHATVRTCRRLLRGVSVSNEGIRFRTGEHGGQFRFVFDSRGGYGGTRSNSNWAFERTARYVLLAMKAELGDRLALFDGCLHADIPADSHDCSHFAGRSSADNWMSWAEPCGCCAIDVGLSRLRQLHQRQALLNRAKQPRRKDVRWWSRSWFSAQTTPAAGAYKTDADHKETRAIAEEDYDASDEEASDRPVHVPQSLWAAVQRFAKHAPNPANLLDYRFPLQDRASQAHPAPSIAGFPTTPSSVIRVGRVDHLCFKSDSGAVCFRVLDPTAGDGVDVPWLKKLTRHTLIPFNEFLHVALNLGLTVASLLRERLMQDLTIHCPDFPEFNRTPQPEEPDSAIVDSEDRWRDPYLLWMRESDTCSSPHRRCIRTTPAITSELKLEDE